LRQNWKRLHRGVYLAAILAILHFYMLVKADVREPLAYGAVVGVLLLLRTPWLRKQAGKLRPYWQWSGKKEKVTAG
jgi:sulfoxide reductase heme-binding subunit YedZ